MIVQAFVAQKRAVQKSAIVRVVDGVAEFLLSAQDRVKSGPDIGDYFASFLHVTRNQSDEQLNRKVLEVVRGVLTEIREILPDRDVPRAYRQAQAILRTRAQISGDAVSEAMIAAAGSPEDEGLRERIDAKTRRKLRTAKLDGLTFRPDLTVLRKPPLRRVRTTEGVTVIYPDDADGAVVQRQRFGDGRETITIRTERVMEDQVVRDGPRTPG